MKCMEYASLGETVYFEKLPNGLPLYVIPRPDYGKQFAFFATHYGGIHIHFRDENGEWIDMPAGVAHYLEHKLFDTADGSITQIFAASGAVDNAFTAADITGYFFEGTNHFDKNLRALLSFVSQPYFTAETVEKERNIIAQEIRMEEDEPNSELFYRIMEMVYAKHPISTRIAGTVESIGEITADTLYQCHNTFYRPGNMVLCVAGSVDPDQVRNIAMEILPQTCSRALEFPLNQGEPEGVCEHYAEWTMPVSAPLFNLAMKGDPPVKGQCLRCRLMAELACDALFSPSSELYNRLYDEGLINDSFGGDYEFVPGAAYLLASGESRDPKRVRDEILAEARHLAGKGIEQGLWERLIRASYGAMVRRLNSLEDTCIELAQSSFDGEDYLRFPEVFQSIEKSDVEELLGRWCTQERTALAVVLPQE